MKAALFILAVSGGCAQVPAPQAAMHKQEEPPRNIGAQREPSIRGRVLLDGRPVAQFGVALSRSFASRMQPSPTVFSGYDGRFSLRGVRPGI